MKAKIFAALAAVLVLVTVYIQYVSITPSITSLDEILEAEVPLESERAVLGVASTATHAFVIDTLVNKKRGGYTGNGLLFHAGLLDDMPSWEYGVLKAAYEFGTVGLSENFSKQVSDDTYDPVLKATQPHLNYPPSRWLYPSSKHWYVKALGGVRDFQPRMIDRSQPQAQFYSRSNGLRGYFTRLQGMLGEYSGRLTEASGRFQYNTNLELEVDADASTPESIGKLIKTPWGSIDNTYWEARGAAWALVHYLRAIEQDFGEVLRGKNSRLTVKQLIHELEETQNTHYFPMVLNGSPDYILPTPNDSLVLANRFSRAAIILSKLTLELKEG